MQEILNEILKVPPAHVGIALLLGGVAGFRYMAFGAGIAILWKCAFGGF